MLSTNNVVAQIFDVVKLDSHIIRIHTTWLYEHTRFNCVVLAVAVL